MKISNEAEKIKAKIPLFRKGSQHSINESSFAKSSEKSIFIQSIVDSNKMRGHAPALPCMRNFEI